MSSPHFDSLFVDTDILMVVDEWKASYGNKPALFAGRTFSPASSPLYDLLLKAGASTWHASGKRDRCDFLFNSAESDEVLGMLRQGDTHLYSHLFIDSTVFASNTPATANWRRLLSTDADLLRLWGVGSPYAQALYWFLEVSIESLTPQLGQDSRIRIVVDQQDWLTHRRTNFDHEPPGLMSIGATESGNAEVFAIVDKSHAAVRPYLPLLGLVDSEAWAYGRVLSLKAADGHRVHEHYLAQSANAKFLPDGLVTPGETLGQIVSRAHANHPLLRSYYEHNFPLQTPVFGRPSPKFA